MICSEENRQNKREHFDLNRKKNSYVHFIVILVILYFDVLSNYISQSKPILPLNNSKQFDQKHLTIIFTNFCYTFGIWPFSYYHQHHSLEDSYRYKYLIVLQDI